MPEERSRHRVAVYLDDELRQFVEEHAAKNRLSYSQVLIQGLIHLRGVSSTL